MVTGTVKWFNAQKGFGFIQCEGTGTEVFLHSTKLAGKRDPNIQVGDRVEFDIDARLASAKRAKNVRKLDLTPAAE
jgi:cold shock protein